MSKNIIGQPCKVCGKTIEYDYYGNGTELCGDAECKSKEFWLKKVQWMEDGDRTEDSIVARINGRHYLICEQVGHVERGSGGQEFYVEFIVGPFAGKIFRTTNLWDQGEIKHYKDQLTDNAIWRQKHELVDKQIHQFMRWDVYGDAKLTTL